MSARQRAPRALVVMAKAPRAGHVKTRLSATLPADAVVALYRCMIEDTIALVRSMEAVGVSVVCPLGDVGELADWLDIPIVAQEGEGLAAGLASAFRLHLTAGFGRVIAFNGDTPHLPPRVLATAFEWLDRADLVVGPTEDGGYYLIGAKAVHPQLFDVRRMGTETALDALLSRARALGLRVALTEPWYDIDGPGDLARLAADLSAATERAPLTAPWLAARGRAPRR
jgi:rSAM/selenodomain-associated transferase 1